MKKTIHMIGNAHLDPVWLWQWREGYQEIKATFRSALDRMNERPDFRFTCACAGYYAWVEENDPEMFQEICERIREGRWSVVGGMWIQPDMNIPSGECLARHFLYSQRYFLEKFGITVNVCYNVDTFGHNAMAPQLFRRSGIDHYVWMRPGMQENPDIPEGTMIWEGLDGSRVTAFRIPDAYCTSRAEKEKIDRYFEISDRLGQEVMCFYGVGNHGGGPTKTALREISEYQREAPRGAEVFHSTPAEFFERFKGKEADLPLWKGELQHHASGCYSTHSASKLLHRQAENMLLRMEKLGALSRELTGHKLNTVFVQQGWKNVMFNEFHDIMGGCALPEALKEAEIQLSEAVSIADREENAALQRISWQVNTIKGLPCWERSKENDWGLWGMKGQGTPVVAFNPHGFDAEADILIRRPLVSAKDDDGNDAPVQVIRATRTNGDDRFDSLLRVKVPAMGYRLYWIFKDGEKRVDSCLSVSETHLENNRLRAEFDPHTGALTHLIDKTTGRDALTAPARARLMDIEACDTWAHMVFRFDQPAGVFSDAKITVLEQGPIRAGVKVVTRFGASILEQKYYLHADGDQLDVEAKFDLREKHRMIKLCFPTDGTHDVAEIPYGAIERHVNGDEECCQRWAAVQGARGGLAIINNGKHSYSAPCGELRMTVANTSIYADHYGQSQRDDECSYMDQGEMWFKYAVVPFDGAWQNADLSRRAALLQQPVQAVVETYHEGALGSQYCGMSIDSNHVDVGAFKRAEDDHGYVLRLYETTGRAVRTELKLPLLRRTVQLELTPFEIKTLYLPDDKNLPARDVLISELEI